MEEVRDAQKLFGALNAVCAERYAENEVVPYFDLARVPEAKERLLDGKKGMIRFIVGIIRTVVQAYKKIFIGEIGRE